METYGNYEFETLVKEEENKLCFDCGKIIFIELSISFLFKIFYFMFFNSFKIFINNK